ncbi:MAG: arsenite methyltransferase [Cyclobacteriaceae bacterium]|nr:arsenite methyltransferase [Cyclobacteriaceae bacterium]
MNTNTSEQIKEMVKEKYSQIADQSREINASSCCGASCGCNTIDAAIMAEDYTKMPGYNPAADLGLGCGLPTEFAQIKEGDVVVDLGSGAGNDCFVARSVVGATGKVIGIDMTDKMIEKARANAEKLGFNNVEFRHGDIERMPITSNAADVVVSNCVLNLVPDKKKAFDETYRILKPGGHFSVSDIVLDGNLPDNLLKAAELYAGCVSGAIQKDEYLNVIKEAGFKNISIQKERKIMLPNEILREYLSDDETLAFHSSGLNILSITVFAEKPLASEKKEACCEPGCCS